MSAQVLTPTPPGVLTPDAVGDELTEFLTLRAYERLG